MSLNNDDCSFPQVILGDPGPFTSPGAKADDAVGGALGPPLRPQDCPKFGRCSAPICPLDPGHLNAAHLEGERVCFYLLEYVKPNSLGRFKGLHRGETLYRAMQNTCLGIMARYGGVRRALARAKTTGARLGRNVGVFRSEASLARSPVNNGTRRHAVGSAPRCP